MLRRLVLGTLLSCIPFVIVAEEPVKTTRVGIIGLDTSHVVAFTKIFNDDRDERFRAVQIVAAFPGGSPDFPLSRDRVAGFTQQLRDMQVEIVDSIETLLTKVDAILLEAVDGNQHLEYARPVFAAKKPLFIDKPLAASLQDALVIAELATATGTPWFSCSSSRYSPGYPELKQSEKIGEIMGCDTYSQSQAVPNHPALQFYGVHGVDLLFSLLGPGCEQVSATQTEFTEAVRGVWNDGRIGTYRSIRGSTAKAGVGATVFGKKGIVHCNNGYDYKPLCVEIAQFFRTGKSPIDSQETLNEFAFLEAAEISMKQGGKPVAISQVLEDARRAIKATK